MTPDARRAEEMPSDTLIRRPTPDVTIVTGAAGWLGTALVHALVGGGEWERPGVVRALVLDEDQATRVRSIGPNVEVVVGDLRRPDSLTAKVCCLRVG